MSPRNMTEDSSPMPRRPSSAATISSPASTIRRRLGSSCAPVTGPSLHGPGCACGVTARPRRQRECARQPDARPGREVHDGAGDERDAVAEVIQDVRRHDPRREEPPAMLQEPRVVLAAEQDERKRAPSAAPSPAQGQNSDAGRSSTSRYASTTDQRSSCRVFRSFASAPYRWISCVQGMPRDVMSITTLLLTVHFFRCVPRNRGSRRTR